MSDQGHTWIYGRRGFLRGLVASSVGVTGLLTLNSKAHAQSCATSAQVPIEGPYFFGEVEARENTGEEVFVSGVVRDAKTCEPIPGAEILRWHANDLGVYEDYYRATVTADSKGAYKFSSRLPGIYAGLDRHIHFRVTAPGYEPLISQLQWPNAMTPPRDNEFDFVLEATR